MAAVGHHLGQAEPDARERDGSTDKRPRARVPADQGRRATTMTRTLMREPAKSATTKAPDGWDTGPGAHSTDSIAMGARKAQSSTSIRGHGPRHAGFNDRWDGMSKAEQHAVGANKRDVWWIAHAGVQGSTLRHVPGEAGRAVHPGRHVGAWRVRGL